MMRKLLMLFFLFLLNACSEDNHDLRRYMNEVKSKASKPVVVMPKYLVLPPFKFPENRTRRNPFNLIDPKKTDDVTQLNQKRVKAPLEIFSLARLKLIGILKQKHKIWALIQQPDRRITHVTVGDSIGTNHGRILIINDNFVQIEEMIRRSGRWNTQRITLNLSRGK